LVKSIPEGIVCRDLAEIEAKAREVAVFSILALG
jgi:hypothetical protein